MVRSAVFWEESETFCDTVNFRTSGSTGEPRWIVLSKAALLLSARAVNVWLEVDEKSVWGLALPMDHVGGFGVAARAYAAGCGFSQYHGKWDARRFAEWLDVEMVTHVSLVPTQVHDLLAAGLKGGAELRAVVVGGGRLSVETGSAARDAGWPVLASYGMTEACSQVATQKMDALTRSFGDSPLELLPIWEAEETAEGRLKLRGAALFKGILEGGNFHRREGEWFVTNDRAEVSNNTILPIGRADALVKVMGELVDLESVERRFAKICEGLSVAVVAVPDARREHALVAVFEGEKSPSFVEAYNNTAPGLERIIECRALVKFPRSDLGKLRRGELLASLTFR